MVVHLKTEGAKNRPRKSRSYSDTNTTVDLRRHRLINSLGNSNCNLVKNAQVGCQRSTEKEITQSVCLRTCSKKGQREAGAFSGPNPAAGPKNARSGRTGGQDPGLGVKTDQPSPSRSWVGPQKMRTPQD